MLKHRAIRLSIKDRLAEMFTAPDAETELAPFNVYYENQLRAVKTGAFTPVEPFVYLLDSYLLPVAQRIDYMQPQVVVEIDEYRARPFEIGNRKGRWITVCLHVFGRDRGQRDDIGAFIVDYFGNSLDIKDYSPSNRSGTVVDTALLDDDKYVIDQYTPRLEQELSGGLLMGWTKVTFKIRPKE